jgi:hypothetical protein
MIPQAEPLFKRALAISEKALGPASGQRQRKRKSLVETVMAAVDSFVTPQKCEDDLTCVAIKRNN